MDKVFCRIPTNIKIKFFFNYRARATNTQLGQDENSDFVTLEVYGEDGAGKKSSQNIAQTSKLWPAS